MKKAETVAESCTHEHCIYRSTISNGKIPICLYSTVTGKSRRCKISECDKHIDGRKVKPKIRLDGTIEWVYETYERRTD